MGRNGNKQANNGNEKLNNVKGITTPRNPITVPKITPIIHPFIHNGEYVVCHLSCGTTNIVENSVIPHPPKTPNVAIDDSYEDLPFLGAMTPICRISDDVIN